MQLFHFFACRDSAGFSELLETFHQTECLNELLSLGFLLHRHALIHFMHDLRNNMRCLNGVFLRFDPLSDQVTLMECHSSGRDRYSSGSCHSRSFWRIVCAAVGVFIAIVIIVIGFFVVIFVRFRLVLFFFIVDFVFPIVFFDIIVNCVVDFVWIVIRLG